MKSLGKTGKNAAVAAKGSFQEALQMGLVFLLMAMVLAHSQWAFGSQKLSLSLDVNDRFEQKNGVFVGSLSEISAVLSLETNDEYGVSKFEVPANGEAPNNQLLRILEDGSLAVVRAGPNNSEGTEPQVLALLPTTKSESGYTVNKEALNKLYGERFFKSQIKEASLVLINLLLAENQTVNFTSFDPFIKTPKIEKAERAPASVPTKKFEPVTEEQLEVNYTVDFLNDMVCGASDKNSLNCEFQVQLTLELVIKDESIFQD